MNLKINVLDCHLHCVLNIIGVLVVVSYLLCLLCCGSAVHQCFVTAFLPPHEAVVLLWHVNRQVGNTLSSS
jgi:hypothetical protein